MFTEFLDQLKSHDNYFQLQPTFFGRHKTKRKNHRFDEPYTTTYVNMVDKPLITGRYNKFFGLF